jgi:hypothetical protein
MRDGDAPPEFGDLPDDPDDAEVLDALRSFKQRTRRREVATVFREQVAEQAHRCLSDGWKPETVEALRVRWKLRAVDLYDVEPRTPSVLMEAFDVVDDVVERSRRRYPRRAD